MRDSQPGARGGTGAPVGVRRVARVAEIARHAEVKEIA